MAKTARKVNREPSDLEIGVGRIIGEMFSLADQHMASPAAIVSAVSRYFDDWEIKAADIRMDVVTRAGDGHLEVEAAFVLERERGR